MPKRPEDYDALYRRLLRLGGKVVFFDAYAADLAQAVLVRGWSLDLSSRVYLRIPAPGHCHHAVASLLADNPDYVPLSGFGLDPDGTWCCHSVLARHSLFIETTGLPYVAYFVADIDTRAFMKRFRVPQAVRYQ